MTPAPRTSEAINGHQLHLFLDTLRHPTAQRSWYVGLVRWDEESSGTPRHLAATRAVVGQLLAARKGDRAAPVVIRLSPRRWQQFAARGSSVVEAVIEALSSADANHADV